jgi:DNA recombination protein RmuC
VLEDLQTREVLFLALGGGALVALAVVVALLTRVQRAVRGMREPIATLGARADQVDRALERSERAVREDLATGREETSAAAKQLREEVNASVKNFGDTLGRQLIGLTDSNDKRLTELRGVVDTRLEKLQTDNAAKLDQMRQTVDEKLQSTLEKRLAESFKQVSERLEAVHKGLGEMQNLANGVGDLKKVLTNVKTRGTWGEIQLGELLEQVMTPDQFRQNVAVRPRSAERVDFAIVLPGRGDDDDEVLLPIDAKFPMEDYQRLIDAQEAGDADAAVDAGRQLDTRIKLEARSIRDKYLNPPATTDFAILFLPTEGLYAEVLRRSSLADLQRDHRIILAGPTTLAALLNSLQMGFRTLAIQKRSSEVWKVLGDVKKNFGQFSDLLDRVNLKLEQASKTIVDATTKSRTIEKKLGKVEELPESTASALLPELSADD